MAKTSTIALLIMLVVGLGLNVSNIINLIGTGGIAAALLFIVGSLAIGFVLGGRDPGVRNVMALGTAQRNVSAALVVTAQNFSSGTTLPFVLVTAILGLLILLPAARLLGRRGQAAQPQAAEPPSAVST
jgi:bile acid:Na+ symporter, BASS family